jgi:hypothetical protein
MNRAQEIFQRVVRDGEAAIDEFIASRTVEELFLDFKRSADNGRTATLHATDRNNLAKAISGFGNSVGGVIIWGIDCSPDFDGADVARAKHPITNVNRFLANLQGAVSGCTIPPHNKVEHRAIVLPDNSGYVVSHIPASNNMPHQMVGRLQYFIRAGSDFVPIQHQVLAGMFGKRPQPNVFPMFTVSPVIAQNQTLVFEYGIMLTNGGPGLAKDVFFTAMIHHGFGDASKITWHFQDQENWSSAFVLGRQVSVVAKDHFRMPPQAFFVPLSLRVELRQPITNGLLIKGVLGCSEAADFAIELKSTHENAAGIYAEYFERQRAGNVDEQFRHDIATRLIDIPNHEHERA